MPMKISITINAAAAAAAARSQPRSLSQLNEMMRMLHAGRSYSYLQ
jgi:hypothetical protein